MEDTGRPSIQLHSIKCCLEALRLRGGPGFRPEERPAGTFGVLRARAHLVGQQGELAAAGGVVVVEDPGFAAAAEAGRRTQAALARRHAGQGGRHRDGGHGDAGAARHLVVVGKRRGEAGGRGGEMISTGTAAQNEKLSSS